MIKCIPESSTLDQLELVLLRKQKYLQFGYRIGQQTDGSDRVSVLSSLHKRFSYNFSHCDIKVALRGYSETAGCWKIV